MQFIKSYQDFAKKQPAFVIRTERIADTPPKRFKDGKLLHFYIRVFIDVEESARGNSAFYQLSDVKLVKYELHPSYYEPNRISEDPANAFEIRIWAYGFFDIKSVVLLQMGQSLDLRGYVRWPVTAEEIASNKDELS